MMIHIIKEPTLSPVFFVIRPFNLHLDFWKSRSASNLRKISSPANLDFLIGLHLEKKSRFSTINLKKIQVTNWKKIQVCKTWNFSKVWIRPWFSEIKVQNKWLIVSSVSIQLGKQGYIDSAPDIYSRDLKIIV